MADPEAGGEVRKKLCGEPFKESGIVERSRIRLEARRAQRQQEESKKEESKKEG